MKDGSSSPPVRRCCTQAGVLRLREGVLHAGFVCTPSRHVHSTPAYARLHPSVCMTLNIHVHKIHRHTNMHNIHTGQIFTLPMRKVSFPGTSLGASGFHAPVPQGNR